MFIENVNFYFQNPEITLLGSRVSIEALKNHPNVIKTYILDKKFINLYKTLKDFEEFDVFFSFRSSFRTKFIKFCISSKSKYQFDKIKYNKGHQVEKYNDFINDSLNINFRNQQPTKSNLQLQQDYKEGDVINGLILVKFDNLTRKQRKRLLN